MKIEKIVVVGGKSYLGLETCRLGRAIGHRMFSVDLPATPPRDSPPAGAPEATEKMTDEPWKHGITWVEADPSQPERWRDVLDGTYALVCCIDVAQPALERMATLAEQAGIQRFVLVSPQAPASNNEASPMPPPSTPPPSPADPLLSGRTFVPIILRPSLIGGAHGSPLEGRAVVDGVEPRALGSDELERLMAAGATIHPVERVALAALRAALESDIGGVLDAEAIEHLGDAVFIQG